MSFDAQNLKNSEVDFGVSLLQANDEAAFSFLGIQAEKLEIVRRRQEQGRALPVWSDDDAIDKVLSDQRATREELSRYTEKGIEFARSLIGKVEQELRGVLCNGNMIRKEIESLSDNTKEIVKYVSSLIVGVLLASAPSAVAIAVTSIATTLAVIMIKRSLTQFCAVGVSVVTSPQA